MKLRPFIHPLNVPGGECANRMVVHMLNWLYSGLVVWWWSVGGCWLVIGSSGVGGGGLWWVSWCVVRSCNELKNRCGDVGHVLWQHW
jgi:hypothetical protein